MAHRLASLTQALQRGLDLTELQASELLQRITPTIALADLTGFESSDAFLNRPSWGSALAAAVVGENGHCQIFNPAESGIEVEIETILASLGSAGVAVLSSFDTALTTLDTSPQFRDRRIRGSPAAEVRRQNNAGTLGTGIIGVDLLALTTFTFTTPVLLREGQGLQVEAATVNVALRGSFFWTERSL